MKKQLRIALVILLFVGMGIFAWVMLHPKEPIYQGKPLIFWLEAYTDSMSAAPDTRNHTKLQNQAAAIAQIGSNAIPTLLKMAQTKDSAIKSNLVVLARKQTLISIRHLHTDQEYRSMACFGFDALGPIGRPAVPDLIRLLNDPKLQEGAALSLGKIGPASQDAVPILIPWLTNADVGSRYCAAEALGRIGANAPDVKFALLPRLMDETNFAVRFTIELALGRLQAYPDIVVPMLAREMSQDSAAGRYVPSRVEALGAYGAQAKQAVPILLQVLSKEHDEAGAITEALKKIDPETAIKVEVR